jgi:hypothetical protein
MFGLRIHQQIGSAIEARVAFPCMPDADAQS